MEAVKSTLKPLPGVAGVEVDFPQRMAKVKAGEKFDVDRAIELLAEKGYDSHIVENTN